MINCKKQKQYKQQKKNYVQANSFREDLIANNLLRKCKMQTKQKLYKIDTNTHTIVNVVEFRSN